MKIYIIGNSGTGKSTLASQLSKKLHIPAYDLDDIKFKRKFDVIRKHEVRRKLLAKIVAKKKWIIEGTYTVWTHAAAKNANIVIEYKGKRLHLIYKVVVRFLTHDLTDKRKKQNLRGFYELCKYIWQYDNPRIKYKQEYNELMTHVKGERVVLRSHKEAESFLKNITRRNP